MQKKKKEEKHLICIAINCVSRNHTKFCNYVNIQLISYKWFLECTLIQWRLYGYIYPQCTQVAEGTFFNKKQLGLKKSIFGPKCLGLFLVTHNHVYYCKMRTLASRMPRHPSRNSDQFVHNEKPGKGRGGGMGKFGPQKSSTLCERKSMNNKEISINRIY